MAELPHRDSNFASCKTALLEALWRGDELAAAVRAAHAELEVTRQKLVRIEDALAEVTEIGDAAQAAIEELRARLAAAELTVEYFLRQRDVLAAELFRLTTQGKVEFGVGIGRTIDGRCRGWWQYVAGGSRRFVARLTRRCRDLCAIVLACILG